MEPGPTPAPFIKAGSGSATLFVQPRYLEEGEVCKAAVEETGLSGHGVRALDGEGGRARRRDHREVGAVKLRVYRP